MLENSKVTCPSHPGSKGVTLTIIPHLAYVDLPKQITNTSSGILKYSIVLANAKELGGISPKNRQLRHNIEELKVLTFWMSRKTWLRRRLPGGAK